MPQMLCLPVQRQLAGVQLGRAWLLMDMFAEYSGGDKVVLSNKSCVEKVIQLFGYRGACHVKSVHL